MVQAAERLEFDAIKAAIQSRIHTPVGAKEVNALAPLPDRARVRERIDAISEARALLEISEPPPVWGAQDVEAQLESAEKGIVLEASALSAVAATMRAGSLLRTHFEERERQTPLLYGRTIGLPDLGRFASDIARCFDTDGQLADHASSDLGPLRSRVRSVRDAIHGQIASLLQAPDIQPYLQETYFTIRAGRHVLPIQASYKNAVPGIVHDASGSGQTVFIEPQTLVDLGNRLKIAESDVLEEEVRILSRLTIIVADTAEDTRAILRVVGEIDFFAGAARLAMDLVCVPVHLDPNPGFSLCAARHPLLLLDMFETPAIRGTDEAVRRQLRSGETAPRREVVANDLALEPEQRILILTGPNTGGKTVAMKTIGLVALMARCGLHVPCKEGSRIGWFDDILVAIGDRQSIASHLSTFAAHVLEVVHILERANERTLALIDEITADTDPTQGQALAQAVLEAIATRGAHAIVTTHYERLKAIPFVDARFRNAGVGFDATRLCPTFHVTLDLPQSSSGFDIAANLGVSRVIVDRARELTGAGTSNLESLLRTLEERATEFRKTTEMAEAARREAERETVRLIEKQRELDREIATFRTKSRRELLDEIEDVRGRVRHIVASLQRSTEDMSARDAMREANKAAVELAEIERVERAKEPASEDRIATVAVGDWVLVPTLGRDGDVVEIIGKDAHVAIGKMRMRVPLVDLRKAESKRPRKIDRPASDRRSVPASENKTAGSIMAELDIRGQTVDESLARIDAFLDHHYGLPTTHVCIIHGHGTGALRDAVREHLGRSGYVKTVRPGDSREGGDGVTIASMA